MSWWRAAIGALLVVAACDSDQGSSPPCEVSLALRVSVPDSLTNADKLQTFIFADGQAVFGDEVAIPLEGGSVPLVTSATEPSIDLSGDFEVVVAGLRTGGAEVLASGRTPTFACTADDDVEVPLYVGPANGFAAIPNSGTARRGATATALPDGRVLIVGGESLSGVAVAPAIELYDHRTGEFCSSCVSGTLPGRIRHTATATGDGRVVIAGGRTPDGTNLGDAYVFDSATGILTAVQPGIAVANHAAVALIGDAIPTSKQGTVLVFGGRTETASVATIHRIDADLGTSVALSAELGVARFRHSATLLSSGDVLIAGGQTDTSALASVEGFDAINDTMLSDVVSGPCPSPGAAATANMCAERSFHSATLLEDDNVLFWGGQVLPVANGANPPPQAEVWVGAERRFYPATPDAATLEARTFHTATRVPCFRPPCPVLVLGGTNGGAAPDSLLFSSPTGSTTISGNAFAGLVTPLVNGGPLSARAEHAALALADGSVLVEGGRLADSSAMVFDAAVYSRCEIIVALEGVECPAP